MSETGLAIKTRSAHSQVQILPSAPKNNFRCHDYLIPKLKREVTVPAFCGMAAPLGMVSLWGIAVVFFGSVAVYPLFVGIGLNRDQFWSSYRSYSLVTGLASIGLFTAFSIAVLTSFQYVGLVQRLFLALPFQWIWIIAVLLRRRGTA